jgi:hypothetical protein
VKPQSESVARAFGRLLPTPPESYIESRPPWIHATLLAGNRLSRSINLFLPLEPESAILTTGGGKRVFRSEHRQRWLPHDLAFAPE